MKQLNSEQKNLAVFFTITAIALLARLGDSALPKWDDLLHVAIARGFFQTKDWITPHYNGNPTFFKPPLYFWMETLLFRLIGFTEYAARLPAALFGFGSFILTYLCAEKIFSKKVAFFSVLVLLTNFLFLKNCRRVMLDVPVAFSSLLGIYAILKAKDNFRFNFLYGFALALGYYLKAIQGLYIVAIIPLYFIFSGQIKRLFQPSFIFAHVLAGGLMALWIVPEISLWKDRFIYSQCLIGPIVHRGINGYSMKFYDPLVKMLQLDWPWIPISLWGFVVAFRQKKFEFKHSTLLIFIWIGVIYLSLISVNLFYPRYLIPLLPPFSILAAIALDDWIGDEAAPRVIRRSLWVLGGILLIVVCTPIKLEHRGTAQYDLFRTINLMGLPRENNVVLYSVSQYYDDAATEGVNFYCNRYISLIDSPEKLHIFRTASRGKVFGFTSSEKFLESEKQEIFAKQVQYVATIGQDVVFEVL